METPSDGLHGSACYKHLLLWVPSFDVSRFTALRSRDGAVEVDILERVCIRRANKCGHKLVLGGRRCTSPALATRDHTRPPHSTVPSSAQVACACALHRARQMSSARLQLKHGRHPTNRARFCGSICARKARIAVAVTNSSTAGASSRPSRPSPPRSPCTGRG